MKNIFILLAATAIFIVGVGIMTLKLQGGSKDVDLSGYDVPKNSQKVATLGNKKINIEIADTPESRAKGLSQRENINENEGLLFIFEKKDVSPAFWMKDMLIAIDIIWINDEKIVQINNDVQPEPGKTDSKLKLYAPNQPVDYVLEVKSGFTDKNNIKLGDNVNLNF